MKKLRIDFSKNTKFIYYLHNMLRLLIPSILCRINLSRILNKHEYSQYINTRVEYYNKVEKKFTLSSDISDISSFKKYEKKKTYYFDLLEYLRYFPQKFKITYLFGDIIHIPNEPSLLKSRPIQGNNQNSILLKLNKVRHFIFVNDILNFNTKKNMLVWRGKCYTDARQKLIKKLYNHISCDIGQTNTKGDTTQAWQKSKLQLKEQLKYKFILTIEGNDVASNLKWVMSSNSIAFMVTPTYETWFMEGKLIPNHHYVLLKDDYSDLEEKIEYYSTHIEESQKIIDNAHNYVNQFKDIKRERLISLLVLQKYFQKSQQSEII